MIVETDFNRKKYIEKSAVTSIYMIQLHNTADGIYWNRHKAKKLKNEAFDTAIKKSILFDGCSNGS